MEEKEENRRKGRRTRNAGGGVDEEKMKIKRKDGERRKTQWEGENEGSERALLKEEISGGRGGVKQKNRKV